MMFDFRKSSLLLFVFFVVFSQNVLETVCIPLDAGDTVQRDKALDERLSKVAEMRSYMDMSVDPCTDFYNFSCGSWPKLYPADSKVNQTTGIFENMERALNEKHLRMLKADVEPEDTAVDLKVKDFYKSCINFANKPAEIDNSQQLLAIIEEFGGMPALKGDAWKADTFDWLVTVAQILHKYRRGIIVKLEILADFKNNTVNRIYVSNADFYLESRSMYVDEQNEIYLQQYQDKIFKELHAYLGLKEDVARKVAMELVAFEVSLARGLVDEKAALSIGELSQLTTATAMTKKYAPTLNMETMVNIVVSEALNDPIYEYAESYQKNLVEVVQKTPKHVVANYIMYTILGDFLLNATNVPSEQEQLCLKNVKKYFGKNLDNMIYRRYNTKTTESDINGIWEEMKQAFKAELESAQPSWIEPETRQKAIDKLEAMKLEINTYEKNHFDEELGEVQIRPDDYLGNIRSILETSSRHYFARLHSPPRPVGEDEDLSFSPVNIVMENKIKVPVMMLQPDILWSASYPQALKFGGIGMMIGHELVHGFDDNGRKFNEYGNEDNWWDAESSDAFDRHTQCFVDQYSRYSYGGQLLPRSETQAENIADNGGVRLAYASYLRWLQQATDSKADLQQETLPTLDFTSKQLFFIAFAQIWCTDVDPGIRAMQTSTDTHTPRQLRVIGTLVNFPEFAKEFNCAKDAPMNAAERCEIY